LTIIFYIGHPAQYHFFKLPVKLLREKGHQVIMIIRSKDILESLLINDGQKYINILPEGRRDDSFNIFWAMLKRDSRLAGIVRKHKPDMLIGSDPSVAQIGILFGIPSIICSEDDVHIIPKLAILTYPFATHIFSAEMCDAGRWNKKKISHKSYQKLGYLHPKYFKPDSSLIGKLADEKYFLIRLAKLNAHHDHKTKGIDVDLLRGIIFRLTSVGKVYISSETPLDQEFIKFKLTTSLNVIHHVMYYSELIICDSQSMTVESAMLGVPSLRFNDFAGRIGILEELEHVYGLTYGIKSDSPGKLLSKLDELLSYNDLRSEFKERREKMLSEKIDINAYLVWLIENYPASIDLIRKNPGFQNSFGGI
jgi:uncharacterized protein